MPDDLNSPGNEKEREKWFREQRLRDLERELEGAKVRGDKAYEKNVRDEIAAEGGGGQRTASKRPRASSGKKETR